MSISQVSQSRIIDTMDVKSLNFGMQSYERFVAVKKDTIPTVLKHC